MPCGVGVPIANQLNAAHFAVDHVAQRVTNLEDARLHLRRAINHLVGPGQGQGYDDRAGGMQYMPIKRDDNPDAGLGQGIIPDLTRSQEQLPGAKEALPIAVAAREVAKQALAKNDVQEIQQSSKTISHMLQSALQIILG